MKQLLAGMVLALSLSTCMSCAAMKQWFTDVTPQTIEEGVVAAHVTLGEANQSFTSLMHMNPSPLSKSDATRINKSLDDARQDLDFARDLVREGQLDAADMYLKLGERIISIADREISAKE